jgi:hypothetical protein
MYSACIGHRKTTFEQSNLKKFGRRVWSNVHVWASHMCDNDYDWGRMRTQRTHVKVTSSSGNFMPVHECVATCNGVVLIELRQYSIKTTLFYTGLSVNAPAVVQAACAYRYFVYKPRFWRQSNHSGGGGTRSTVLSFISAEFFTVHHIANRRPTTWIHALHLIARPAANSNRRLPSRVQSRYRYTHIDRFTGDQTTPCARCRQRRGPPNAIIILLSSVGSAVGRGARKGNAPMRTTTTRLGASWIDSIWRNVRIDGRSRRRHTHLHIRLDAGGRIYWSASELRVAWQRYVSILTATTRRCDDKATCPAGIAAEIRLGDRVWNPRAARRERSMCPSTWVVKIACGIVFRPMVGVPLSVRVNRCG